MSELKELQRHELYVGVFPTRSWTSKSLCDYFHQLIEGSTIVECRFYPCVNEDLDDHCFAVLTFASRSSIDQCLSKSTQIKQEHRLTVKRNLKKTSKDQRPVCKYISVQLTQFEPSFNRKNVLAYFTQYGSITECRTSENSRTFIISFEDYDSVDRIILDEPHFFSEHPLSIQKCFNPYTKTFGYSIENILKEKIRNLQAGIERTTYSEESELKKLQKQLNDDIAAEENRLSDTMKAYIRLERIQRDLKQDLTAVRQRNQRLHKQIHETLGKNKQIVAEFESQLEKQRLINKVLQESTRNLAQTHEETSRSDKSLLN